MSFKENLLNNVYYDKALFMNIETICRGDIMLISHTKSRLRIEYYKKKSGNNNREPNPMQIYCTRKLQQYQDATPHSKHQVPATLRT